MSYNPENDPAIENSRNCDNPTVMRAACAKTIQF